MLLLVRPTCHKIIDDNDLSEDEIDYDDILFTQGYNTTQIEIEDGENFIIPQDYIGIIDEAETFYLGSKDFPIEDELSEGKYQLNGNMINKISS